MENIKLHEFNGNQLRGLLLDYYVYNLNVETNAGFDIDALHTVYYNKKNIGDCLKLLNEKESQL